MKIKNINVKISAIQIAVFIIFTLILLAYVVMTGDVSILYWGIPTLVLLLLIPMGMTYLSQRQYAELIPMYEAEAKKVSVKAINLGMIGTPVRLDGVVEAVHFKYLNRPQFIVADKGGEISVKMFTSPAEDIVKGDVVEVLGTIIRRYFFVGDAVINCVSIRKIRPAKQA